MQEMGMGETNMAMGATNGDETLLVKFMLEPTKNEVRSAEEGRPIFEDIEWISIRAPGSREERRRPMRATDRDRFPEHYRRFKAREEQVGAEGTPLFEWPGITRSQAEELKFYNIVTVEQLASMSDASVQNSMGWQTLKTKAQEYLEASKGNATAEALLAAKEKNELLQDQVNDLAAQVQALTLMAEKPKRKRRTKAQMEADKAQTE